MRIAIPTKLNQKLAEVTPRRTLPQGIFGRATEWRKLLNLLILPPLLRTTAKKDKAC